jgi:predicted nucleic acid-binding protein
VLLLDVNVVLAAHRGDHPDHRSVRGWFDAMLAGEERFTVPAFSLNGWCLSTPFVFR